LSYSSHLSEFAPDSPSVVVVVAALPLELKLSTGSELAALSDVISFSCAVILNISIFAFLIFKKIFYQSSACSKFATFPLLIALSLKYKIKKIYIKKKNKTKSKYTFDFFQNPYQQVVQRET